MGPHNGSLLGTDNQATAKTAKSLVGARTGESFYITKVIISNGPTAGTVKLVSDTPGATADLFPALYLAINDRVVLDLAGSPIKVPVGKDIGYTSVTVTNHTVIIFGFSLPTGT